jgi:hypothetical protein
LNFLVKIEDAINKILLIIFEKIKALLPGFIFEIVPRTKEFIHHVLHSTGGHHSKIKLFFYKSIGYTKLFLATGLGYFTTFSIYLRSDEFKHNKLLIITNLYKFCIQNPKIAVYRISAAIIFSLSGFLIASNIKIVLTGTKNARTPASIHKVEYSNENELVLKNHKFEVALKAAGAGHGGAGAQHEEIEVIFDVTLETSSQEQKELLEEMEEKLDVELEAFDFNISGLPLSEEERALNEKAMMTYINLEFFHIAQENVVKKISLKQSPKHRPVYFGREDQTYSMKDISLQVFLEDLTHNRQITFDYSLLASNRNVVLYLKDHEDKVRDRLSTQIEPIVPRLPIEDEGRSIIKDKIRYEINELLKEEKIEGRVLEIYIDYIIGS